MTLARWGRINRGRGPISADDEYHFYQALIGIWPGEATPALVERLKAYMLKAAREAKSRTSWINPDEEYEAGLQRFVEQSLADAAFVSQVKDTVARLARPGMLVGLSQAAIKVASPGVPDYYQGTELWDFSLVDPDNRRPVDYGLRRKALDAVASATPEELLANLADGRAKLHVIRKGLEIRRKHPALFHGGRYTPLYADGGREDNVIAYWLSDATAALTVVAPRLFFHLMAADDLAPLGKKAWGNAALPLKGSCVNVLTGERLEADGRLPLADVLRRFPVALLLRA
jgi:(1->4)-alpha-D-glucan 1-alpha-D-glucosylmutase